MPDDSAFDSFSLRGRVALVTGASSGIGRHLAGVLADAGAAVALAARRADKVDAEAAALRSRGAKAIGLTMDVCRPETHGDAFERIFSELGAHPQVLLNCAGVLLAKPFLEHTEADFDGVMGTNLRGAFFVGQRAARHMSQSGGGSIVNVASTAGLRPGGQLSGYCASKAGLIHLTRVMALELARHGIRVNALCPGNIETEMHDAILAKGFADALVKRIPQHRFGKCEDLAGAALLLASEAGRYITGSVLAVDGGQLVASL